MSAYTSMMPVSKIPTCTPDSGIDS